MKKPVQQDEHQRTVAGLMQMGFGSWWHWAILAIFIVPKLLYLISQQKVFSAIPSQYRSFSPALVWLGMIPLFYLVWNFIVLWALKSSLARYSVSNSSARDLDGGFIAGLISSIGAVLIPFASYFTTGDTDATAELAQEPNVLAMIPGLLLLVAWLGGWVTNWILLVATRKRLMEKV